MSITNTEHAADALARQTGFSPDAVASMTRSITAGNGRMAQFDHPEFGGAGQWMQGGPLMISDFSDHELKQRIARLCEAIAASASTPAAPTAIEGSFQRQSQLSGGHARVQDSRLSASGWPASLGSPDTSGAQDDMRYAWFADVRRLAIDVGGAVTWYDTGDHRIGGVAQQQGGTRTLSFTSQDGPVDLSSLAVVEGRPDAATERTSADARPPVAADAGRDRSPKSADPKADPFQALEKLADLHARGIVADDEFAQKKAELLARI